MTISDSSWQPRLHRPDCRYCAERRAESGRPQATCRPHRTGPFTEAELDYREQRIDAGRPLQRDREDPAGLPRDRALGMARLRRTLSRDRATRAAFGPGVADARAAVGEACGDCIYSIRVHVDAAGGWLGCPSDEAAAVTRWGRR